MRWLFNLLRETVNEWLNDDALALSAALAYYGVFSITPLLLIVLAAAELYLGEHAAQGKIIEEIRGTVGEPVAHALQGLLQSTHEAGSGVFATIIGVGIMLAGASAVFAQLQSSLNIIWKVKPRPGRGLRGIIYDRFFSLVTVIGTGFLLLLSVAVSGALSALRRLLAPDVIPGEVFLWQWLTSGISFVIMILLFAMIFRVLPDAQIRWRDVWIGAILTAALFVAGKYLLELYLTYSSVASAYGAAGSLVVILLWVYYSSLILLFGAEFTRVHTERYGGGIRPAANAVPVAADAAQQRSASAEAARPTARDTATTP